MAKRKLGLGETIDYLNAPAQLLLYFMMRRRMSVRGFADSIKISHMSLGRIISGKSKPVRLLEHMDKICASLQLSQEERERLFATITTGEKSFAELTFKKHIEDVRKDFIRIVHGIQKDK